VALTKADRVPAERLAEVRADIAAAGGTPLAGAPIFATAAPQAEPGVAACAPTCMARPRPSRRAAATACSAGGGPRVHAGRPGHGGHRHRVRRPGAVGDTLAHSASGHACACAASTPRTRPAEGVPASAAR
jgi:hypothetical protein